MITIEDYQRLYDQLPEIDKPCPTGCTECCGPIILSRSEAEVIYNRTGKSPYIDDNGDCIFSLSGRCDIYDIRPFICRIYGVANYSNLSSCHHGCRCSKMLPFEKANTLLNQYTDLMQRDGKVFMSKFYEDFMKEQFNKRNNLK